MINSAGPYSRRSARPLAAESEIDDTHAIADAEKRHRQGKKLRIDFGRIVLIHASRAARENNPFRLESENFF